MLSLNATQQTIIASSEISASWLFTVTTAAPTTYRWSTKAKSFGGQSYTATILADSFGGISLNRSMSELSIQAPNTVVFSVTNSGNALSASDFEGASVLVQLVCSDGTNEAVIAQWKFRVKRCHAVYQRLEFICVDFVQEYLEGDYPDTPFIEGLAPSNDQAGKDGACVPVPFGTAYIPLRSVYVEADGARYYLLGPTGVTYTISEVRSPREWGSQCSWSSAEYTFTQATKTLDDGSDYRVFQPIIADSDNDGTADASGLWLEGDKFLDMPTKFSRSDTASTTSPADIIASVLEGFGVPAADIDTGVGSTFEAAAAVHASWSLEWNGALWQKEPKATLLARLLNMCHCCLRITDKVELHVLSKTPQATIDKSHVLKMQTAGEGTFRYEPITQKDNDSGYVAFQVSGEPQDALVKILVAAKGSTDNRSSEILELPWVQDSQAVQTLGTLYYQRKLLKKANIRFTGLYSLLALQPDDVVTIDHADYGGTYTIVIDSMTIRKDLSVDFGCIQFKSALDDFGDLAPGAVTPATDDSVSVWQPVLTGPDAQATLGRVPNVLAGRLRIGTGDYYIIINPDQQRIDLFDTGNLQIGIDAANKRIYSGNYVSGIAGSGFLISPDLIEANNVAVRGIMRCAVFQKDVISAVGGNMLVLPSDVLAEDMTAADASTLTIEGNETFAVDDILRIKDGTDDEWLRVTNAGSAPTYTVTRDLAGAYASNANPAWGKGAAVVNYRQSGDGGLLLSSSEGNAPYLAIFNHAGSPWSTQQSLLRLGNLNGYLGYIADAYGIAIGDSDNYLKYDPTNGLVIQGQVTIVDSDGNVLFSSGEGISNVIGFNMVKNGDFSTGDLTHWSETVYGNPIYHEVWTISNPANYCPWAPSGSKYGKCYYVDCNADTDAVLLQSDHFIPVDVSKTYNISAWIRKNDGAPVMYVGLTCYDESGVEVSGGRIYPAIQAYTPGTNTWMQVEGSVGPVGDVAWPSGTVYVKLRVWPNYMAIGSAQVSRIQFHEGTSPMPWTSAAYDADLTSESIAYDVMTGPGKAVVQAGADKTSLNTAAAIANQGAFATLSKITVSNISTYISSAAIGSAYIADAAITSAKIANAAITNAHIKDYIQSVDFDATHGWKIDKNGGIIARNITITDSSGNIILTSGSGLAAQQVSRFIGFNMVKNGDFALNTDGWEIVTSGSIYYANRWIPTSGYYTPWAPGASKYGRCFYASIQDDDSWIRLESSYLIPVDPARDYCYSLWLRNVAGSNPTTFYAGFYYYDSSGAAISYTYPLAQDTVPSNVWHQISCVMGPSGTPFPANTAYVKIWIYPAYCNTGGMLLSRIQFHEGTSPMPWTSAAYDADLTSESIAYDVMTGPGKAVTQAGADKTSLNTAAAIANQGAFATLSKITVSNISTYISSAAIGSAYIADAAILNAKIDNAAITTLKIDGEQVTVPRFAYAVGPIYNNVDAWKSILSITIPVDGYSSSVFLFFRFELYISTSYGMMYTRFCRDTTLLIGEADIGVHFEAAQTYRVSEVIFDPNPGTGNITYNLRAYGDMENQLRFDKIYIMALVCKSSTY